MDIVRGERVCVRTLMREDVDKMQQWSEHSDPLFFYYNFPKMTKRERDQWYKMKMKTFRKKSYAIENEFGKVIGYLSIRDIKWLRKESELGIVIDPGHINQGYGSEAIWVFLGYYFQILKMSSLKLRTAKFNKRAIKCYKHCGFHIMKETEEEFEDQQIEIFSNSIYNHLTKLFTIINGRKMTKYLHMKITKDDYKHIINSLSTKDMQKCE